MNIFKQVSIKSKLLLIFILPTLVLIYQIAVSIVEKNHILNEAENLSTSLQVVIKSSSLIHELQKERGATVIFLSSKGKKFADSLNKQKENTTQKISDLENLINSKDLNKLSKSFIKNLHKALSSLKTLDLIRKQVSSLNISKKDAIKFYTTTNELFLESIVNLAKYSNNPKIIKDLNSFVNFLYSKERVGIERAIGTAIFSNDSISVEERITFNNLIAEESSYIKSCKILKTDEEVFYYDELLHYKIMQDVDKMRNILLKAHNIGGFNIDANVWFATITKKLLILKEVEDFIASKFELTNQKTKKIMGIAKSLNTILHETQKERAYTTAYLASKGSKFKDILQEQFLLTEKTINLFKSNLSTTDLKKYSTPFRKSIKNILINLSTLEEIRASIKQENISSKKVINFYTHINNEILKITENLVYNETDAKYAKTINTYYSFLMLKEKTELERALLTDAFFKNKFTDGMKIELVKTVTQQDTYLDMFIANSDKETYIFYNKKIKDNPFKNVLKMREIALNTNEIGGFGVNASVWFNTISIKINLLKGVENKLSNNLTLTIDKIIKKTSSSRTTLLIISFLIILLAGLIYRFITQLLTDILQKQDLRIEKTNER
jgi:methyl-accepting chemotaxis protein